MAVGKVGEGYIEIVGDADDLDRDIDDATRDRTVDIEFNTNGMDAATSKIRWVARNRRVWLYPLVDNKALAAAEAALTRLSGGRVLKELADMFLRIGKNVDTLAPKIGALSIGMMGLLGSGTALLSNLSGIVYSLGQIGPAALAVPGLFAGMAIGAATLVTVLRDMGTVLKDLGPQFTKLQDYMSKQFWGDAEAPIRNMVSQLLPIMNRELGYSSQQFGILTRNITDTVSSAEGLSRVSSILNDVGRSVEVGAKGAAVWTEALLRLTSVGTSYLPTLAEWSNRVGESFNTWLTEAENSGDIFRWIDESVVQLKALGVVLRESVEIIAAIGKAAQEAGGSSLQDLANGLTNLSDALSGVKGQEALIAFFRSGHALMEAMMPGLREFGAALRDDIIPMLETAMPRAGEGLSATFSTLGQVFSNPAFTGGFVTMIDGAAAGLEHLQTAAGPLGDVLGALGRVFGEMAEGVGKVVASGLKEFGPSIVLIADAVRAVIPVLTDGMVGALEAIGPIIEDVIGSISTWVQENPGFASGLLLVGGALGIVGGAVKAMIGPFTAAWPVIQQVAEHFGGFQKLLGAGLKGAGVIGVLIGMYTQSEAFRDALAKLGGAIWSVAEPALAALGRVFEAAAPAVNTVLKVLGDLAAMLIEWLIPRIEELAPVAETVFGAVATAVETAFAVVTPLLEGLGKLLTGDVVGAWETMVSGVGDALSPLGEMVSTGMADAGTAASEWVTGLNTDVNEGINGLVSDAGAGLMGMRDAINTGLAPANQAMSDWANGIGPAMQAGWVAVTEWATGAWDSVMTALSAGWQALLDHFAPQIELFTGIFSGLGEGLGAIWTGIWEMLKTIVAAGFLSLVAIFTGNWALLGETVVGFATTMRGHIDTMVSGVLAAISGMWTSFSKYVMDGVNAVVGFFAGMWKSVTEAFSAGVAAVLVWMVQLPGKIMGAINGLIATASAWASNLFMTLGTKFLSGVANLVAYMAALPGKILAGVASLAGRLGSWAVSVMTAMKTAFTTGINSAVTFFTGLPGRIMGALAGAAGMLRSVGTNMILGLISGITSAAARVAQAAREVVTNAIKAAQSALGINSPSKVFMGIGKSTGLGLTMGMDSTARMVEKGAERLTDAAMINLPSQLLSAPAVSPRSVSRTAPSSVSAQASGLDAGNGRPLVLVFQDSDDLLVGSMRGVVREEFGDLLDMSESRWR